MKVLITGGAGFIGSNLAHKYAQNKNNDIYIIDNLSTGKIQNIKKILNDDNVTFIQKDIRDDDMDKFIRNKKFDYVYNLACPASPRYYLKFPIETWEASVLGVRNILKGIKETNTKMVQASTSEVYGNALEIPQKETYLGNVNCIGVRACYDEGKRAAESLIFDYQRLYDVNVRVVRIFNTYGPKMDKDDGRIISNFINQAIRNEDITIYGTGEQTRSFCYIDDTIEALIAIMNKKEKIEKPINIGNPVEISVYEVANLIKDITKSKSNIVFCEPMKDEPQRRKPDINEAKRVLNWIPKNKLEDGLKKCIEFYLKENETKCGE